MWGFVSLSPRRISGGEEEGFFGTICWLCLCLPGAGTLLQAVAGSGQCRRKDPPGAQLGRALLTLPRKGGLADQQRGSSVPSGPGTGAGSELRALLLLPLPAHSSAVQDWSLSSPPTLSVLHTLQLEGSFPTPAGSGAVAQAGRAGQAALLQAGAPGRAVPGLQNMYRTALVCPGMWPQRGAWQLLSHSQRHDTTVWDRTWMDLQSGQCQQCRAGAVGPLLNPSMAWGATLRGWMCSRTHQSLWSKEGWASAGSS